MLPSLVWEQNLRILIANILVKTFITLRLSISSSKLASRFQKVFHICLFESTHSVQVDFRFRLVDDDDFEPVDLTAVDHQHLLASFDVYVAGDDLEEGSALDLVAVVGVAEPLDVLLVLGGGDQGGGANHALVEPGVSGKASDLASNTLHALLGLNNGLVHVLDPVDDGITLGDIIIGISLPSDGGEGDIGGEEEEETNEGEDWDEEGGQIKSSSGLGGGVGGGGVAWFRGAIGFGGGSVGFSRGGIGRFRGAVGWLLGGAIGVITLHQMCTGTSRHEGDETGDFTKHVVVVEVGGGLDYTV